MATSGRRQGRKGVRWGSSQGQAGRIPSREPGLYSVHRSAVGHAVDRRSARTENGHQEGDRRGRPRAGWRGVERGGERCGGAGRGRSRGVGRVPLHLLWQRQRPQATGRQQHCRPARRPPRRCSTSHRATGVSGLVRASQGHCHCDLTRTTPVDYLL